MSRSRLLFVCLGNACRSQMAEAFVRHKAGDTVEAASAGVWPLGKIPGMTRKVMEEKGISLEGHTSKGLDALDLASFDLVLNMSGVKLDKLPATVRAWTVKDPYGDNVKLYRNVRDEIEQKVSELLAELLPPEPEQAQPK